MQPIHRIFAAALLVLAASVPALAGEVFTKSGAAIRGYDPVAYFTDGKPVKGSASFEAEWNGTTWRFASAEHRDLFTADPAKYAPQYGGHCAWAVSQGYTAPTVPEAWRVVDGKLYLNYSLGVRAKWERDVPGNIGKADRNWPGLRKGL